MKNIIITAALVALLVLGFRAYTDSKKTTNITATSTPSVTNINIETGSNGSTTVSTSTPVVVTPGNNYPNEISITIPTLNQLVSTPLNVSGRARGSWYFEASAPVIVKDSTGKTIGQGHVEAEGDWMTSEFVPFHGTVTFTNPTTATGSIVFMNDNPSGDPERSKSVTVPVRFR